MSKTEFSEIFEGHLVAENKNWQCEMDKPIKLAYYIEILNMDDATGEEQYKDYPYIVSIGICAAKPHKSFDETDNDHKPSKLDLIYYCNSYMGNVPVDHKFIDTDAINKNITSELKACDAYMHTYKADCGTVAAQKDQGAKITYPQFKEYDCAEKWAKALVNEYGDMLMSLIGFTLDQPINMAGDTGWNTIEQQVKGA